MAYQGFGKGSGPTAGPPTSQPTFGMNPFPRPPSSSASTPPASPFAASPPPPRPRSVESSSWSNGQNLLYRDLDAPAPERPTAGATFVASRDSTMGLTARVSRFHNPEMTRSPPLQYVDADVSNHTNQTVLRNPSNSLPLKSQSPPLVSVRDQPNRSFQPSSVAVQQPALASNTLDNPACLSSNNGNSSERKVQSSVSPNFSSHNSQRNFKREHNSLPMSKRTLSPPSSVNEVLPENFNVSPKDIRRSVSSNAPKRTRSPPPSFSADETLEGNINSSDDNSEREMLAKAKRLARFKVELSKSEQNNSDITDQKAPSNRHVQSVMEQKYVGDHSKESSGNYTNSYAVSDYEGLETSNIILGLCPDMCPESERAERERKGDLDQYERLDGDRNVTSKFLAVKKYNRTAEREASLIRPMPILQKTIDYLLNLLHEPYDERFLGIYNFLWDRMRAIRMDLRMQHIFNQGAINMLEQMIRLHIIAMHELCEYTKGEGFSEGFDAHLNIEQMNKTSVELFEMYDDHRRKGIDVPTEKEFRGYYALLKLDKHPGYKVEPAELSLDLAKMPPEIRQTPEVLFARDVARACRTGNFIAFFRLARKASYLQACLMHAHFAKLRAQALASIHAGLQNNQGLPVSHVANWLAMEDEGIEDLLDYHGFLLKAFEEPYLVKEGPFLKVDNDYPTKCSKLVHKKRSGRIIEDVSPSVQAVSLPAETTKEIPMKKTYKPEARVVPSIQKDSSVHKVDEEMFDSEVIMSPKVGKSGHTHKEMPLDVQHREKDHPLDVRHPSPLSFSVSNSVPKPQFTRSGSLKSTNSDAIMGSSPKKNLNSNVDGRPSKIVPKPSPPESSRGYNFSFFTPLSVTQSVSTDESMLIIQENGCEIDEHRESHQDEEIAEAKLKLFLRLWKRRASKLRMLREQRQLAANAALNSLSLGPPIRHYMDQPSNFEKFDIDKAMRERYEKQEESWARLNVSDIVSGTLSRRNSDAKCLCWKIILCSQMDDRYKIGAAGLWLTSKLMPSTDDDLVISSHGLAIWKKWFCSQSGADPACCFSVLRDTTFGNLDETASGASAVIFLVSESIPWNLQRIHLNNLLMSIPSGACLPLLILCGSSEEFSFDIINELGLHDIDNSRISGFQLVFLVENQQMKHLGRFFSDRRLREGLEWLASESPLQPTLLSLRIRELVHAHLNFLSVVRGNNSKMGPNDWITVFNEALDCSAQEIIAAAHANPAGWPCPEIGLIVESSDEDRVVKRYLPTLGWSSNAKIEPIICSLQDCTLPTFPDDLSWLAKGSNVGYEIENHRLTLENSLIQYLTHASKMMSIPLATKEAHVTLQTCARLELHGSSYYIVPHWGMIFRRIFNWRLLSLSNGEFSSAYISECHHVSLSSSDMDVELEANLPSSYGLNLSLDEIMEVSCNSPLLIKGLPRSDALEHLPQSDSDGATHEAVNTSDSRDAESNFTQNELPSINTAYASKLNSNGGATQKNVKATKETDKLSKLLEQCNLLQDVLDEKLSVYF
ncbi:hypothetical protein L6164_025548 [Bauhinia variegata]|uniref:Uncharacterized protein n=1 Tax=Bauhinia variegata TaxID=167791 RepID=A0ACB9M0U1_BAUVA|nr:hypothetical protein L6164_025548 [Bauhinia variegata]